MKQVPLRGCYPTPKTRSLTPITLFSCQQLACCEASRPKIFNSAHF